MTAESQNPLEASRQGWSRGEGVAIEASRHADRRRLSVAWLVAFFFALGWHGIWWIWVGPEPVQARIVMPDVPQVTYMPFTEEEATGLADGKSIHTVWSPALFSLPTPVGFSRSVLTNAIGIRPPLAVPVGETRYLERKREGARPVEIGVVDLDSSVSRALTNIVFVERREPVFGLPPVTGVTVTVQLDAGLEGVRFSTMSVPVVPSDCAGRSWQAEAVIEADAQGRVRHAFLDSRSPCEAFNTSLVQTMRHWRVENPEGPVAGRVTVRCFVPPVREAQTTRGGAP